MAAKTFPFFYKERRGFGLRVIEENDDVIANFKIKSLNHEVQLKMENRKSYRFVFFEKET